ncbi:MAG TPA: hypothetical protein VML75_09060 [Kofleriaceae bacterium]|nr:hypothetical protein [Kofleriaceae bacterium]
MRTLIAMMLFALVAACGSSTSPPTEPTPPDPTQTDPHEPGAEDPLPTDEPAARPTMTVEECEQVGTLIGDPGDGSVHRPDFRCPSGSEPVGTVPLGIEGSVCCPH